MPGHVDGVEDDPAKHEKPKKCLKDRLADSNLKSSKVTIDVFFTNHAGGQGRADGCTEELGEVEEADKDKIRVIKDFSQKLSRTETNRFRKI